jgi:hypothetical protein
MAYTGAPQSNHINIIEAFCDFGHWSLIRLPAEWAFRDQKTAYPNLKPRTSYIFS